MGHPRCYFMRESDVPGWATRLFLTTMKRKIATLVVALCCVGVLVFIGARGWYGMESPQQGREVALQENLRLLRLALREYTIARHRPPQSLDSLVSDGYLKRLPIDPMTEHNDTWVAQWSSDPTSPGIVNVRSGSQAVSGRGTKYSDW